MTTSRNETGWPSWADTPAKRAANVAYWQAHNARVRAEAARKRWHFRVAVAQLRIGRAVFTASVPVPWFGVKS
jgi:hypothetical protein